MYIPSLDMGEYDDYSRPPPGTGTRQTSRKRAEQVSRIPSGYFIVDDETDLEREGDNKITRIPIRREHSQSRIPIKRESSQSRIPIRRENSQPRTPIRRENSQSSLYSSQYEEREGRSRTLPRQSSRSRLLKQESRGSLRRHESPSRTTHRKESVCQGGERQRDVYSSNKNAWQNSLRGASTSEGESRGRSRVSRCHLDPGARRSRSKSLTGRSPSPSLLEPTYSSRAKSSGAPVSLPRRSPGVTRPSSGDSGYHYRAPPTIVRRSASPPTNTDDENPFANYRSFDEFKSNKDARIGSVSGSGRYSSKTSSDDYGAKTSGDSYRTISSQRQQYRDQIRDQNKDQYRDFTSSTYRKVSNSSTESDSCFGSLTGPEDRADSRLGLSAGLYRNQESNSSYGARQSKKFSLGFSSSSGSGSPTKFSLGALKRATISSWDE